MESISYDELKEEIIEIDVDNLETLTYETLLEVRELNNNTNKINLSSESEIQLNQLIQTEKQNIEDLKYFENLGFNITEDIDGHLKLRYNGLYGRSIFWSFIFGSILSVVFVFLTVFLVVGAFLGSPDINVDFFFLISTMIFALLGGTGIVLIAKAIDRINKRKRFLLSVSGIEYILHDQEGTVNSYPKSEYKLDVEIEDSIYQVILKSTVETIEIFDLTFSNTKLHKTIKFVIHKLNEYN